MIGDLLNRNKLILVDSELFICPGRRAETPLRSSRNNQHQVENGDLHTLSEVDFEQSETE
jgi:hypothetical protein